MEPTLTDKDRERYEQNFRDIFTKLNKTLTTNSFALIMTVVMAAWASMFGLLYTDLQGRKTIANEQRIEVIRELGEVKELIAQIKQ